MTHLWVLALALWIPMQQEGGSLLQEAVSRAASDELEALRLLQELSPEEAPVLEALAFLHLKVRLLEEAQAFAAKRESMVPRSPQAEVYLGDIAWRRGLLEEARDHYDRVLAEAVGRLKEEVLLRRRMLLGEEDYRRRVGRASKVALWGGVAVLAFLLVAPFLVLGVFHRDRKKKGGEGTD